MANVSSIKPTEGYVQPSSLQEGSSEIANANGHKFSNSSDTFSTITDATKGVFQNAASLELDSDTLSDSLVAKPMDEVSNQQDILIFKNFFLNQHEAVDEIKKTIQQALFENNIIPANADTEERLDQTIRQEVDSGYAELEAASSHVEIKDNLFAMAAAALRKLDLPSNFTRVSSDGKHSAIAEDELDDLINSIADQVSDSICAKFIPGYQAKYDQHVEEKHEETHVDHEHTETANKTHTVANLRERERTPATENQFQVSIEVEVLGKLIILEGALLEKMREEKSEEKREQMLQDLIDRIKHDVIKREVLSQEVKSSEIKLEDLKGRLNKFIDMPIDEMVKISQAYSKAAPGEVPNRKIRLQLPGIHRMKSVAAA